MLCGCSGAETHSGAELQDRALLNPPNKKDRTGEVNAYVMRNHHDQGHKIVRTDTLDDGTVVDWVDAKTVPGSDAVPPPPLVSPGGDSGPPSGTAKELLSGPPGALPFIRPAFIPFVTGDVEAADVDDYLRRISAERAKHGGPAGNPTAGAGNRLFASNRLLAANFGLSGNVNNFWNGTEAPTSPDFSFYELASYCLVGVTVNDLVGVILGKNPQIYGNNTVIGAEYFNGGTSAWITGGGDQGPWHQVSTTKAPGMAPQFGSDIDGTQAEWSLALVLFNSPRRWWLWIGDEWVGYFDTTQAFSDLDNLACAAQWYSEVYDPDHASTDWTNADSGSGRLPNGSRFVDNFRSRGYLRLPVYYTAIDNAGGTSMSTLNSIPAPDPNCYNVTLSTDGGMRNGLQWNPTLFFGGPGGNGPGCN
jgi:Neprosin